MTVLATLALALSSPAAEIPGPCEIIVANSRPPARQSPAPPADLDRYIACEMKERQIPGVAIAITQGGRILTQRAYGLASVQNDAPVTLRTRFEIASITKPITAMGIMLLVQDGRIELDSPLSRYLGDAPADWRRITVRHLLNHTSGLAPIGHGWVEAEGKTGEDLAAVLSRDRSTAMEYKLALKEKPWFEPGTDWAYSDLGYFLLGVITERVSGISWREFMRRRIFAPVGMADTYMLDLWGIYKDEARAYTMRNGQLSNARRDIQKETPSHYGIFSNVGDLAKLDAALYSDRLLNVASKREMWRLTRFPSGDFPYSLGWEVWSSRGHSAQFHGGSTGTEFLRLPKDGLAVIVLTNLGGGTRLGIAHNVAKMVLPSLKRPPLRPLPISRAELSRYAGTYRSVEGDELEVRLEGDRLSAPYPWPFPRKGGRGLLVHHGEHRFEFADHDGRIRFITGPDGRPKGFVSEAWDGALRWDFMRVSAE